MKKIFALLFSMSLLCACQDHLVVLFSDYYVCIKDETESATSIVPSTVSNLTVTYYVSLVAPALDNPVKVDFEIKAGDGLTEKVDYEILTSGHSVTIPRGVARMPIRIKYLSHPVDPSKDNTLTIKLTGCDDGRVSVGYPGPAAYYSSHVVTKTN